MSLQSLALSSEPFPLLYQVLHNTLPVDAAARPRPVVFLLSYFAFFFQRLGDAKLYASTNRQVIVQISARLLHFCKACDNL